MIELITYKSGSPRLPELLVCYHCGQDVPLNTSIYEHILDEDRVMCCHGCAAVARTIIDSGLSDYYRFRSVSANTADSAVPDILSKIQIYDDPEIQRQFVRQLEEGEREAMLVLEGIVCPACVWLNEKTLNSLPGVSDVQVNYDSRRATVRWNTNETRLSQILEAIHKIGYQAHPFDPQQQQNVIERERKQMLLRLGVAGVLGMQVMMISVGLYVGEWKGMETQYRLFFQWLNCILTLPVIIYSSRAFFEPALRDLSNRRAGMDVPVSLGILLAFFGSLHNTIIEQGHVYYDSVVMFTFFLLLGRYLELLARKRSNEATDNLIRVAPAIATRLQNSEEEIIPVVKLNVGDMILIKPGEAFPADGLIVEGSSSVDESLLTGESMPQRKTINDEIVGASLNIESPLIVEVQHVGSETVLSHILRVLERAQAEKPGLTILADKAASWFVMVVILLAFVVALYWKLAGNEDWFGITLAVLVVTCPCALSLATPAALVAATSSLMKRGLLTIHTHAIETLGNASHFVFDKTGTLTEGRLRIVNVETFSHLSEDECLNIAAQLESRSEHPLAKAILAASDKSIQLIFQDLQNHPGMGVSGSIGDKQYLIGNAELLKTEAGITEVYLSTDQSNETTGVWLAENSMLMCRFDFKDTARAGATQLIENLQSIGLQTVILSGDNSVTVRKFAKELDIKVAYGNLRPEDKLNRLRELQEQGARVAMLGDGINDAPVLAGSDVSIAMGTGTQLARATADMVLLNGQLSSLYDAILVSRKTLLVIRQNIFWAVGYNLVALPAAALGYISPWMAAIGMSLSSLLVVVNSLRISQ